MKRLTKYLIVILAFGFLISCDSDENQNSTENSQLLVSQSPWGFNRFEVIEILDNDDYDIQVADITSKQNQRFDGQVIRFNSDGTGTTNNPLEFNWKFNGSKLVITNGYIYNLNYDLTISDSDLILSSNSFAFQYQDLNSGRFGEIIFEGKIHFK